MSINRRFLALGASALLLAGCANIANSVGNPAESDQQKPDAPAAETVITSNAKSNGATTPGSQVKISASPGWSISVISSGGGNLTGAVNASGAWVSQPLPPSTSWMFTATASDPVSGNTVSRDFSGTTSGSKNSLTAEISPSDGTYGVGIIPRVTFSDPVDKKDRPQLEKRMTVNSTVPVAGTWYWETDQTAAFRPNQTAKNTFLPGHSKFKINVDLKGAYAHDGKDIAWGTRAYTQSFKTGRAMVIYVNAKTDQGYVTIDGKKAKVNGDKSFGVSLGKPGYTSRSGVKTITDKYAVKQMTNEGVTTEEVYDLQVPYAMQITDTGEYFHGAPWNGNIGYANTSHGCTNLEYSVAQWFYNKTLYGDPLITTGTSRQMEYTNGPGAAWNIPEKAWQKG